ncbi:MAG: hypothetical protein Tsb0027_15520 [Wenzhouxiangellaceae bacterium]
MSRVIEMAWEDRTPFAAIACNHGLTEADVITLMRRQLKPGSFRLWRQRVSGRRTKHFNRLLKNSLLSDPRMERIVSQAHKCLRNGARRGHAPRLSELKKARDGLFRHPVVLRHKSVQRAHCPSQYKRQ